MSASAPSSATSGVVGVAFGAADGAGGAYAASGHSDRFAVYQPPDNHAFRAEYLDWMANFFKRFLVDS